VKRFYRKVTVIETGGGWQVALDGRGIRTQRGTAQVVPTRALADALAVEWEAQGEKIDPRSFVLRDTADFAIDVVRTEREQTVGKLLAFAETDTLCYRAHPDEPFYRRQHEVWEPLVAALEAREGVVVERVSGVIHRPQRPETIVSLGARLASLDDFTLAAVQAMASLAASLCIALAALEPDADAQALWSAAGLEEEWQAELWGRDAEAEARRDKRREEFLAAFGFARLVRD
jgi:chaperone required for assembly of F1-ATPase